MKKNIEKKSTNTYENSIVICNTKGGEGKSYLALHILPLIYNDKEICIYELDNNNDSKALISNTNTIEFKSLKVSNSEDAIDEIEFSKLIEKENLINVIDCGGGDDTLNVLSTIVNKRITGLKYIVPITASISNVNNALDTVNKILECDNNASISLVLNRCPSYELVDIKNKFKALFGNEEFDLPNRLNEFKNISNINYILETDLVDIITNKYKYSLLDAYLKSKLIIENFDDVKREWIKLGKDEYLKNIKLSRINEEIYDFCTSLIKSFKLD